MRPRLEIRALLAETVPRLHAELGPVSAEQIAQALQLDVETCRWKLRDMATAGEVTRCGRHKAAGATHWVSLYEPADLADVVQPWGGIEALADVMRSFPAGEAA